MNKVDVMTASRHIRQEHSAWHPDPTDVRHAPYRREPYVRVRFPDGPRDGKALAWTRDMVLFHAEPDGVVTDVWVPAHVVTRIRRQDSHWPDPYDLLR